MCRSSCSQCGLLGNCPAGFVIVAFLMDVLHFFFLASLDPKSKTCRSFRWILFLDLHLMLALLFPLSPRGLLPILFPLHLVRLNSSILQVSALHFFVFVTLCHFLFSILPCSSAILLPDHSSSVPLISDSSAFLASADPSASLSTLFSHESHCTTTSSNSSLAQPGQAELSAFESSSFISAISGETSASRAKSSPMIPPADNCEPFTIPYQVSLPLSSSPCFLSWILILCLLLWVVVHSSVGNFDRTHSCYHSLPILF